MLQLLARAFRVFGPSTRAVNDIMSCPSVFTDNSSPALPVSVTLRAKPQAKNKDVHCLAMREPAMLCRLPSPQRRQAVPVSAGTGARHASPAVRVAVRSLSQELYRGLARWGCRAHTDATVVELRRSGGLNLFVRINNQQSKIPAQHSRVAEFCKPPRTLEFPNDSRRFSATRARSRRCGRRVACGRG